MPFLSRAITPTESPANPADLVINFIFPSSRLISASPLPVVASHIFLSLSSPAENVAKGPNAACRCLNVFASGSIISTPLLATLHTHIMPLLSTKKSLRLLEITGILLDSLIVPLSRSSINSLLPSMHHILPLLSSAIPNINRDSDGRYASAFSPSYLYSAWFVAIHVNPFLSFNNFVTIFPSIPWLAPISNTEKGVPVLAVSLPAFTITGGAKTDVLNCNGSSGNLSRFNAAPGNAFRSKCVCAGRAVKGI